MPISLYERRILRFALYSLIIGVAAAGGAMVLERLRMITAMSFAIALAGLGVMLAFSGLGVALAAYLDRREAESAQQDENGNPPSSGSST